MDYLRLKLGDVQYKKLINFIDNLIVREDDGSFLVKQELNKIAVLLRIDVRYLYKLYFTRLDLYNLNWTDFF